ncbi:TetR/AcrR family transcriptional regulator [Corynebacterium terpenotabidum]|uniref:TetR family transcriptional regulator n=1 Tax=Corynebacterium terpenotabidum Y-11 TaxID=1200352 RepID=S4XI10_9CORY|nr:TetR family transcriptional regulator [Corynebacterium terpenotabidum]AGP30258.1 TetR family transcriptional regulator [Corynebacterium terpenotabidum Y-11]
MSGQSDSTRRPGRRVGDSGTRETILATALEMFADRGFAATSVRAIAKQAEVDPALVRHFFGTKQELFTTAVVDRSKVAGRMAEAFRGPADSIGERLVRTYFTLWEDPETGPLLQTLFRSAVSDEELAPLFVPMMFARLQDRASDAESATILDRATLATPQILGVAVCRYIFRIPVIAEEPLDDLVARLAPQVQRILEG